MKRFAIIGLLACGLVVAMLANGSLQFWPSLKVSQPTISSITVAPIISFTLLALLIARAPKFLNISVLAGAAAMLSFVCLLLLLPSLQASNSTDAQSGMGEALLGMATLPYTLLAIVASWLSQVIGNQSTHSK